MAVDLDGRVVLWTDAAERLLGYAASEVLGRRCYEVLQGGDEHGNVLCHLHCHVLTMARRRQPAHAYDLWTCCRDGAERWLNVSTLLVPDGEGTAVVHLMRDVTGTRTPQRGVEILLRRFQEGTAPPRQSNGQLPAALTPREREILSLLASGESTRVIARRLFISIATVRNHTQSILGKLGVHSRLAAVALASRSRGGSRVARAGSRVSGSPSEPAARVRRRRVPASRSETGSEERPVSPARVEPRHIAEVT